MFSYPFMVNAFEAGTIVAVLAGLVGWFMVLRRETFIGHTLAVVGFPGAAGATLLGLSTGLGYFVACGAAALVLAGLSGRGVRSFGEQSAAVGVVQAFALACGFLFASLYAGNLSAANSLLFGSFLGITIDQVRVLLVVAVVVVGLLALTARRLVFASVDPAVAAARGVPVGVLTTAFLLMLGATAAATSQITGALLVFALLVLPASTAQVLTTRPGRGAVLAVSIAVAVTWLGLTVAYASPYPMGFWVTSFAFAAFVSAKAGQALAGRRAVRTVSA